MTSEHLRFGFGFCGMNEENREGIHRAQFTIKILHAWRHRIGFRHTQQWFFKLCVAQVLCFCLCMFFVRKEERDSKAQHALRM